MKNELHFVTGNIGKFEEIKKFFKKQAPELRVIHENIDLDEIQSLDLKKVAIHKAKQAWQEIKKPLIVDDGGFFLEAYNNFPGALSKFVMQGIGIEGIFKLAESNSQASFRTYLVFSDGPDSYQLFEGVCAGKLVRRDDAIVDPRLPYRSFFQPAGFIKSYAELMSENREHDYHHRIKALNKFLEWYSN